MTKGEVEHAPSGKSTVKTPVVGWRREAGMIMCEGRAM